MVQANIIVSNGKMYVIGASEKAPVYYEISIHELKQMLVETKKQWHNASTPSKGKTENSHAGNATNAEIGA